MEQTCAGRDSLGRLRTSTFPRQLADTWIGDVVVLSNSGEPTSPSFGCANVALSLLMIAPASATGLGIAIGEPDFARVMAILTAICVPLAIYVWWAARRFWRIARLINRGEHERARRAVGEARSATFGPLVALLAQMRGEHQRAAEAYSWNVSVFLHPAANLPSFTPGTAAAQAGRDLAFATPTARAAMLRAAIAFTSVGRYEDAARLLGSGESIGVYCQTLERVAASYLLWCTGQPLFADRAAAEAMAAHFRAIRGSWGGLSLVASGLQQLGEPADARSLIEEELQRPGAAYLPALLPRLGEVLRHP